MPAAGSVSKEGGEDERWIISASGVPMPRLIYGTAWKKERTAALVELALRSGFRGVDTACQPKHYHEAGVGEALSAASSHGLARSEIYVQTKFTPFAGQDPNDVPYDTKASLTRQVVQSFQASLRNLRTDYLDGLFLHSPYPDDKDTLEAWRAMEGLYDQAGVRQLGVSNCYEPTRLEALCRNARIKPAVIQNRFYAKTHYDRAQLFFRYLTQLDIACLTGTSSKDHMEQDLSIFEFRLSPAECETLGALLRRSP
jgi:diketogulonate reductase-like aldo/keto reductase